MDTPQGKMGPSPPKIGADGLKMAKVPWELAPQVKNFPAAEGGPQSLGNLSTGHEKFQQIPINPS